MASLGGARGLNLEDELGSLAVGKKADVVLYDLKSLSLLPRTDPIGLLVLGRPANAVDSVWVNGDRIVSEGSPTGVNVDALRQALFDRSEWSATRKSPTIAEIEAHYRQVMGLPEGAKKVHS
jgi:cytosine/adenosine deaminase-related metal-dependent hydrolase